MSTAEKLGQQIRLQTTPSTFSHACASESSEAQLRILTELKLTHAASDIFLIYCYVPEPKPPKKRELRPKEPVGTVVAE